MTTTEELIANLSKESGKKQAASTPMGIFVHWLLVSVFSVMAMLAIFGLRIDLAEKLQDRFFIAEIFTLSLVTLSSAFAAAIVSFPDLYQRKYILLLPPASLAAFLVSLGLAYMENSNSPLPVHSVFCLFCITMFSMLPALWMFWLLRKQAPTMLKTEGCVILLAACSIGALTLRLSENTDSIIHLVLWHYLPMLGYAMLGAWLGKKILKW